MDGGKKVYVKNSPAVYAYTSGSKVKYTTAKRVTVNRAQATLKKGTTFTVKAGIVRIDTSKKLMPGKYATKLRFLSSDTKVATVSKNGKIMARGEGTCHVYAYAQNGVYKKIEVVVKP